MTFCISKETTDQRSVFCSIDKTQIHTEDLVDGAVGGQCAVKDAELTLESLGNVVTATSGVDHGSHDLHVHNGGEVPRFVQAVHARHLHHLTHNLIGDLKGNGISLSIVIIIHSF